MRDVLIITGPMDRMQLGVPAKPDYAVITIHPSGDDIGSNAMHSAMASWLGGASLRSRVEAKLGEKVGKIGVAWFSAGHGSVRAILDGQTTPDDVCAWMCCDGLYGSADWAIRVARAAVDERTSLLATASTSTPGQYDHSLDRWRFVMQSVDVPPAAPDVATRWGLPSPQYAWSQGSCLVAGYDDLDHFHQVPAVRGAMLRWWDAARAGKLEVNEGRGALLLLSGAAGVVVGTLGAYLALRRRSQRDHKRSQRDHKPGTSEGAVGEGKSYMERLVAFYGVTDSPELGGFLLPDGRFLDFSEGSGSRAQDHRNITWATVKPEGPRDSRYDVMARIAKRVGMYRWMPETWGLETWTRPTPAQIAAVRSLARMRPIILDMSQGKRTAYKEYEEWDSHQAARDLVSFYGSPGYAGEASETIEDRIRAALVDGDTCYAASEALYHAAGGKKAGYVPQQILHEGVSHWFLRGPSGEVIDLTASQFKTKVPYDQAKGVGFLTRCASKRARNILRRAGIRRRCS